MSDGSPDEGRDDVRRLREGLDRELAGLTLTDEARRRLRDGLAGRTGRVGGPQPAPAGRRPAAGRPLRWPVPVVTAAVVVLIAVPGLVARQLRASPPVPSPSVVLPGARTTASPTGRPTPSGATTPRLVLSVAPQVVRPGTPVVATVTVARGSGGPADGTPATDVTPSTGPTPMAAVPARPSQALTGQRSSSGSGRPGSPPGTSPGTSEQMARAGVTLLQLDWGDGATDVQRLACPAPPTSPGAGPAGGSAAAGAPTDGASTVAAAPRVAIGDAPAAALPTSVADDGTGGLLREPLTFRHLFRRSGTYTVVVTVGGTPCWWGPGPLEATVVVRGG